jgi:hypothetical protein
LRFELTDSEPLDALQFKQWQSELAFGSELRGSDTVIRPQLQAPWMISEEAISSTGRDILAQYEFLAKLERKKRRQTLFLLFKQSDIPRR